MSYTFINDHIPFDTSNNRRPNIRMNAETITIHNTGNTNSTAKNERAWLTNPRNKRQASFHYVVDSEHVIECVPPDYVAWHGGDGRGKGNMASISIEICESGDYARNEENAVKFTAKLLFERNWNVDRLRRHFEWSKKICPRKMYSNGTWSGWESFKKRVQIEVDKMRNPQPIQPVQSEPTPIPQWKLDIIKQAKEMNLITTDHNPLKQTDKAFALAALMNGMHIRYEYPNTHWTEATMIKAKELGLIVNDNHMPTDIVQKWFLLQILLNAIEVKVDFSQYPTWKDAIMSKARELNIITADTHKADDVTEVWFTLAVIINTLKGL